MFVAGFFTLLLPLAAEVQSVHLINHKRFIPLTVEALGEYMVSDGYSCGGWYW